MRVPRYLPCNKIFNWCSILMFHSCITEMGYFKYVMIAKTLFLLSSRTFFEMAPKLSKQYSRMQYKPLLRFRMMCLSIGPGSLVFFFSFNQRFNNHYQALLCNSRCLYCTCILNKKSRGVCLTFDRWSYLFAICCVKTTFAQRLCTFGKKPLKLPSMF